ncbi:hypothetical protein AAHE18_20G100700 [Arachis hypogaea]
MGWRFLEWHERAALRATDDGRGSTNRRRQWLDEQTTAVAQRTNEQRLSLGFLTFLWLRGLEFWRVEKERRGQGALSATEALFIFFVVNEMATSRRRAAPRLEQKSQGGWG